MTLAVRWRIGGLLGVFGDGIHPTLPYVSKAGARSRSLSLCMPGPRERGNTSLLSPLSIKHRNRKTRRGGTNISSKWNSFTEIILAIMKRRRSTLLRWSALTERMTRHTQNEDR